MTINESIANQECQAESASLHSVEFTPMQPRQQRYDINGRRDIIASHLSSLVKFSGGATPMDLSMSKETLDLR